MSEQNTLVFNLDSGGDVVIRLRPDLAPQHVERIRELASEGLDDVVTVVHAPLVPVQSVWPDEEAAWYEQSALKEMTAGQPIDLLVVDGPPAYQAGYEHSRYPAGPFFASTFADDYAIVLDDIDRRGEQDIMERWESELDVTFERRLANGRIGIGRPGAAFTV